MIVYTANINGKDLLQPQPKEEGVRYVCFADRKFVHHIWEYEPIEKLGLTDPRRIARRHKTLSHVYFPGEDTIWIDCRVKLKHPPSWYFQRYKGNIVIRRHHARQCIYKEAQEVLRVGYEEKSVVDKQMDYLRSWDYPVNNGLHETGIVLRRWSDDTIHFNQTWWGIISAFSKRDQLSADFVSYMTGIKIEDMDRNDVLVGAHSKPTTKDQ